MVLTAVFKQKKVIYFIVILSFLGAIFSLQRKHYHNSLPQVESNNYEQQIELAEVALKTQKLIPTFGFNNLRADLTYLQFVQYFGDQPARERTGYTLVPSYFETVVDYDPNFTQANLSFSVANSMYAGQPEKTVTLMEKILVSSSPDLEDNYLIWFVKGLDELLFLGDKQAALNSHQNSIKSAAYQKNSDFHNLELARITKANQRKIKYLATDPDTTETQILAWKTVLPNVVDPINRQRINDRIFALEKNLSYSDKVNND